MRAHRGLALALAALGGLLAGPASAATAVVPQLAVNLETAELDALTTALAAALRDAGADDVRGGREVRRRLPPGVDLAACPSAPDCVADLRARLEVEALVFIVVTKVGARVQVDPVVIQTRAAVPKPAIEAEAARFADAAWLTQAVQGWLTSRVVPPPPLRAASGSAGWPAPSWVTWAGVAVTAVALATGIGLGLDARRRERALVDDGCESRACPTSEIDALARTATGADVAYALAGVAAAGTIGLYFLVDVPSTPDGRDGPGLGVGVAGRF